MVVMAFATNQSTQYNIIHSAYTSLYPPRGASTLPSAEAEELQVYTALNSEKVNIKGKRVLDLACGNGRYCGLYLQWGAVSVTGVDISTGMVETARVNAKEQNIPEPQLKFVIGDVTDPGLKIDGDFDIVTSTWLLNYAPDISTMTRMWDTVARHLKPGGYFFALTIWPLLCARKGRQALEQEAGFISTAFLPDGACGKYGSRARVLGVVEDGLHMEFELGFRELGEEVAIFETYFLGVEAFDEAVEACKGGDGGCAFDGIEWQPLAIPQSETEEKPVGYWNLFGLYSGCRALVARRV